MTETNSPAPEAAPPAPAPAPTPAALEAVRPCANCGTPLLGPTCYRCGQPVKGLVRPLTSILGDFLDTVLSIDSRLPRTIAPLYFKPGFLSNEYFAGRRVPYVTPLRMYFFLSVLAFLVFAFLTPPMKPGEGGIHFGKDRGAEKLSRMTSEERKQKLAQVESATSWLPESEREKIRTDLQAQIADAEKLAAARATRDAKKAAKAAQAKSDAAKAPAADADAETDVDADANAPEAPAAPAPPGAPKLPGAPNPPGSVDADDDDGHFRINGKIWDPKTNPITFAWLTDGMNAAFNEELDELIRKTKSINKDPGPFVKQMFSVAPQALFVILPLFALLLKIFYLFKRRLYMEHLIVALHSHSFICLSLLVIVALSKLSGYSEHVPVIGASMRIALIAACAWMPLYVLLMQKRVYRQGWILTGLKFVTLGIIYCVLLTFAMLLTMLVSLVLL